MSYTPQDKRERMIESRAIYKGLDRVRSKVAQVAADLYLLHKDCCADRFRAMADNILKMVEDQGCHSDELIDKYKEPESPESTPSDLSDLLDMLPAAKFEDGDVVQSGTVVVGVVRGVFISYDSHPVGIVYRLRDLDDNFIESMYLEHELSLVDDDKPNESGA